MAAAKGRLSIRVRLRSGAPARSAQINVYSAGTTTPATLYRNSTGTPAVTNPVTADAEGGIDVYVAPGAYDVVGPDGTLDRVTVTPAVAELVTSAADPVSTASGTGTLNGATEVTVATAAVTADSRIWLSIQAPGGTPAGAIFVSSRSAGVSFGVKGTAGDTSTFAWSITEPAA